MSALGQAARLRSDLTLEQALLVPLIWAAMSSCGVAPTVTPALAAAGLGFTAFCAASRNTLWIAAAVLISAAGFRLFYIAGEFPDQPWIQWFSVSLPLTGTNPYAFRGDGKTNWALYLPAGNWYGGLLIALGIHAYSNVWHVIMLAIYTVPVAMFRGAAALVILALLSHFQPMIGYTSGGGNVEISAAVLFFCVWLLRCGQFSAAVAVAAFALLTRQTTAMAAPFLLLALWRAGRGRHAIALMALCLAGGGLFFLLDPVAAIESIRFHATVGSNKWMGKDSDLHGAFSIAGMVHGLGVPPGFLRHTLLPYYLPAVAVLWAGLFVAAWRQRDRDRILLYGCLAQLGTYFLGRYGLATYLPSAATPFAAFLLPAAIWPERRPLARIVTGAVMVICLISILAPMALWSWALISPAPSGQPFPAEWAAEVEPDGKKVRELDLSTGVPIPIEMPLRNSLVFRVTGLPQPRAIRLSGPDWRLFDDKGVRLWNTPVRVETSPSVIELAASASESGPYRRVAEWNLAPTVTTVPVTLPLPTSRAAGEFYKLTCKRAFRSNPTWTLGKVELLP